MKNKNRSLKIILISVLAFLAFTLGVTITKKQVKKDKSTAVVVVGLPKDSMGGMQAELKEAFHYKSYLDKGNKLVKHGNIDEAVKEYKTALSLAKISGAKALAVLAIADAYEKGQKYQDALKYVIMDRDQYVNEWAKEPIVERALYLDYALRGEYALAVEHAQKALQADAELPNRPNGADPQYYERLNNLKAAKDHILSLKEKLN